MHCPIEQMAAFPLFRIRRRNNGRQIELTALLEQTTIQDILHNREEEQRIIQQRPAIHKTWMAGRFCLNDSVIHDYSGRNCMLYFC